MAEKPQISAAEFVKAIGGASKLSGADILNNLMNNSGNLHMKSNISDPRAYAAMHVEADWRDAEGYNGSIFRAIANYSEEFSVGKDGKRASMIAEAVVSVMVQEFEIEKSKARLMGR